MDLTPETTSYFKSICEREIIFVRKELLHLPQDQWTDVPVYKQYRFCNVHRCYDKTYKLMAKLSTLLRADTYGDLHPGLRAVLRRYASNSMVQWLIDNLIYHTPICNFIYSANCGHPEELFAAMLDAYHNGTVELMTGSFVVRRSGRDYEEMLAYYKAGSDFYALLQDNKITTSRDAVAYFKTHAPLCADFTAYCIVSDWLYLAPQKFIDRYTWTAYGPGAYNGINLIVPTTKKTYLAHLRDLHTLWQFYGEEMVHYIANAVNLNPITLDELCTNNGYLPISQLLTAPLMLDVEHWLCEYAKYVRGWSRKKYRRTK